MKCKECILLCCWTLNFSWFQINSYLLLLFSNNSEGICVDINNDDGIHISFNMDVIRIFISGMQKILLVWLTGCGLLWITVNNYLWVGKIFYKRSNCPIIYISYTQFLKFRSRQLGLCGSATNGVALLLFWLRAESDFQIMRVKILIRLIV